MIAGCASGKSMTDGIRRARLATEQVAQGLIEVGLAEPVPGLAELVGRHALTGAGEFAGALLAEQ